MNNYQKYLYCTGKSSIAKSPAKRYAWGKLGFKYWVRYTAEIEG